MFTDQFNRPPAIDEKWWLVTECRPKQCKVTYAQNRTEENSGPNGATYRWIKKRMQGFQMGAIHVMDESLWLCCCRESQGIIYCSYLRQVRNLPNWSRYLLTARKRA